MHYYMLVYIFIQSFFFTIVEGKKMKISKLIYDIKKDKEKFGLLIEKFNPLIKKYVRLLYKDDKEDVYAELVAALWESVCNMEYYYDDGQITNYFIRALRNKFLELYRTSKKKHDNTLDIDEFDLNKIVGDVNAYDDLLILNDLNKMRHKLSNRKRKIFDLIFYEGYSDKEVATELGISRQYVHRVRCCINEIIKQEVLNT